MMKLKHKQILVNTIKIVLAAVISILVAHFIGLNYAISTGIVAMLTIQPTKRETIETAIGRFVAFIIALIIAFISFKLFGFTIFAFFVYLLFFVVVCQIFGWTSAMTMNSVLISHFVSAKDMGMATVINEVLIFVIGVGTGIIANMHLRKNVDYIEELKETTDEHIKTILKQMANGIVDHNVSEDNNELFFELRNHIRNAKNVAEENYKNQLRRNDIFDLEYIRMRDRQYHVLVEMYKFARHLDATPHTAKKLSDFMLEMSVSYHRDNTCEVLMEHFVEMDKYMKAAPLPVERNEFENRATLFGLMRHMEEFLQLKMDFVKKFM
ncbi:MAG: aromatic acid exporter family protein [Lachnospiraceae bacterium]|nr:aromatic acid exporter family protein [Lachnospiraceae bacterium]